MYDYDKSCENDTYMHIFKILIIFSTILILFLISVTFGIGLIVACSIIFLFVSNGIEYPDYDTQHKEMIEEEEEEESEEEVEYENESINNIDETTIKNLNLISTTDDFNYNTSHQLLSPPKLQYTILPRIQSKEIIKPPIIKKSTKTLREYNPIQINNLNFNNKLLNKAISLPTKDENPKPTVISNPSPIPVPSPATLSTTTTTSTSIPLPSLPPVTTTTTPPPPPVPSSSSSYMSDGTIRLVNETITNIDPMINKIKYRRELYNKIQNKFELVKSNNNYKSTRIEIYRQLGQAINQIAASITQLNLVIHKANEILNKYKNNEEVYYYCINFIGEKLFDLESYVEPSSVVPYVYFIEGLNIEHSLILDYTIGLLYEKCDYLIPDVKDIEKENYEINSEGIPLPVKYFWIFCYFCISNPYKNLTRCNLGMRESWYWLSSYLNKYCKNNKKSMYIITPCLLETFYSICGSEFQLSYRNQAIKIENEIINNYLPLFLEMSDNKSKKKKNKNMSIASSYICRLKSYLTKTELPKAEGLKLKLNDSGYNPSDGND